MFQEHHKRPGELLDYSACLTPGKDSRKEERKESLRLQGGSKQVSARLTGTPRDRSQSMATGASVNYVPLNR